MIWLADAVLVVHALLAVFIQRWISRLLYYDLPVWVFKLLHVAFGLVVLHDRGVLFVSSIQETIDRVGRKDFCILVDILH
ncbi:hypothetical protein [Paraburkholderia sp. GAS348]|uniref:hypothetical protein n=1 Tax=Paraburkholderia sp. GAS348 TaxID=3035132 RepID=UPI003D1B633F